MSAAHIIAILESLHVSPKPHEHTPSQWDKEKLINEQTLCDWLDESPDTVSKWRVKGTGPQFLKSPKNVRYQVGHVRYWLKRRTVSSTSEASVKGLSRLVEPSSTAFPVFTYHDGLRLGLLAAVACCITCCTADAHETRLCRQSSMTRALMRRTSHQRMSGFSKTATERCCPSEWWSSWGRRHKPAGVP
ncbi:hypothetical protein ABL841_09160 [Variovorax paradoxus]|uniref:hypothetical protein n=1 Tax=Variovorax paradoxus TaxID=34073 RepID=UPI0012BC8957|nr:hypothetical protein [Variovorax paradoxus]